MSVLKIHFPISAKQLKRAEMSKYFANLDTYLRTLLIHGARSVINAAEKKAEPESWLKKLMGRRNTNVAAVALANKNARIIWALLAHGRKFHPDYTFAQTANV